MKKFITITLLSLIAVVSCKKFDDSKIWDKLNDHENRILLLEELCKKLNADIINLQTIVTALETNDYIVNASPLATGDGYTFLFKSGKSIVVYNGKDGANGKDGVTPQISIKQDVDGVYYWTINGEWLIVNGEKVVAKASSGKDGKDGVTPLLKVEDKFWYISYDNGQSWETLWDVSTNIVWNSIFSQVTQDDYYVYLYLSNGEIITLPKHGSDAIYFEDLVVKAICCKKWDTNADGELSYDEAKAVTDIGTTFKDNDSIIAFNELQYFTGLSTIPYEAFWACSQLWKIKLPDSISIIEGRAFGSCTALTNIEIPANVTEIQRTAFEMCKSLRKVELNNKLEIIGKSCFSMCDSLKSVDLSNTKIYNISDGAFASCDKLSFVYLGSSTQSIGKDAFRNCSISELYINSMTPPSLFIESYETSYSQFTGNSTPFIIYVPNEAVNIYKEDKAWSKMGAILGYEF